MTTIKSSAQYPLPERLAAKLAELHAYWSGIRRGYGLMPYWDDVDMTKLRSLRSSLLLFDVMDTPPRFRFSLVGKGISDAYGAKLEGRFIDEMPLTAPLEEILKQCRATVAESAPTYLRMEPADGGAYARLLLPLWGNGRVDMLIGAIENDIPSDG